MNEKDNNSVIFIGIMHQWRHKELQTFLALDYWTCQSIVRPDFRDCTVLTKAKKLNASC